MVNAWIWRRRKKVVEIGANYLGKLERGVIRWPGELYRQALREILGAPSDAALGFSHARRAVVKLADVDRQTFLRTAAKTAGALALTPVAALLERSEPTPIPARVGATEIAQIRTAARVFASWDFTYGGGLAREAVLAQLRWSASLLEARCSGRLRTDLLGAVGHLAETAGFMAFDAGAHDEARRVFRFGLGCADQARDWHLRAAILADMARQAVWNGHPDEGLTYSEHALVRADRLTATERAMLHTTRARALAAMRRVRETLLAVGAADDYFTRAAPESDAPFMAFYDAAQHAGDTGHALADLAPTGHGSAEATTRLRAAITNHGPGFVRSKVMSQIKLASLTMTSGDPVEAAEIGTTALEHVGTLRSRRTLDGLREVRQHAVPHQRIDAVAHLQQRITTLLLAS